MTEVEVQDLLTLVAAVDGVRAHLDEFIVKVTGELETIQVKLSRILKEVQPPFPQSVSMST